VDLPVPLPTAGKRIEIKKADVAEGPEAFDHVGLLVNRPPEKEEWVAV
jgi:hypothetical protein